MAAVKTVKVGIDYDEPMFPWYEYAHDAMISAGVVTQRCPLPKTWSPFEEYGLTLKEWVAVIDAEVEKGVEGMYGRPLHMAAVQAVRALHRAGFEVHLITARGQFGSVGEKIKDLTRKQVREYKLPVTKVHFAKDKRAVIRGLGIKYFLDDRPNHYLEGEAGGAQTYLLDATWNEDFDVPLDRRVRSTAEFAGRVMEQEMWEARLSR